MKTLTTLLLLFAFLPIFGQTTEIRVPDFDEIEKEISKRNSDFYYPDLMNRFQRGDETLTSEDFHYLYYGYVFQEAYQPYWRCSEAQKIKPYFTKEQLTTTDCDSIIKYAQICLSGFSQGCMMSINLALTSNENYNCVVGFSGKIIDKKDLSKRKSGGPVSNGY